MKKSKIIIMLVIIAIFVGIIGFVIGKEVSMQTDNANCDTLEASKNSNKNSDTIEASKNNNDNSIQLTNQETKLVNKYVKLTIEKTEKYGNAYYKIFKNDKMLSIAIFVSDDPILNNLVKVYNININTGKEMSLGEVVTMFKFSLSDVKKFYIENYLSFLEEDNKLYIEEIKTKYNDRLNTELEKINTFREKIKNDSFNLDTKDNFFIDNNNLVFFINNFSWKEKRMLNSWAAGDAGNTKLLIFES